MQQEAVDRPQVRRDGHTNGYIYTGAFGTGVVWRPQQQNRFTWEAHSSNDALVSIDMLRRRLLAVQSVENDGEKSSRQPAAIGVWEANGIVRDTKRYSNQGGKRVNYQGRYVPNMRVAAGEQLVLVVVVGTSLQGTPQVVSRAESKTAEVGQEETTHRSWCTGSARFRTLHGVVPAARQ